MNKELLEIYTDYFIPNMIYLIPGPYVSTSGGLSWFKADSGFNINEYYLSFYQDRLTSKLLYILRTDGLYSSRNDTIYWSKIQGSENLPLAFGIGGFTPSDRGLLKNIVIDNNSNTLYVGTGYGIYKRDYTSDVNHQTSEGHKNFRLEQNYPNPFNSSTIISYQIPEISFITLKVYDILGNEIKTLVAEEKMPGIYQIEFFNSNLSSGVYLYRLRVNDYVNVKKMLLLK